MWTEIPYSEITFYSPSILSRKNSPNPHYTTMHTQMKHVAVRRKKKGHFLLRECIHEHKMLSKAASEDLLSHV